MRFLLLMLLAIPLAAGEYAVLATGFRLHADRHEVKDGVVRLFAAAGGVTELPAEMVLAFEPEDYKAPPPVVENPETDASPRQLLDQAAERYGLPTELLHSVAAAESGYRQEAISYKGAIGVMQLMPGTASELGADPHDPVENIDAGARYLRDLVLRYDGGLHRALAAYNAGAGAVQKYNGVPPYRETENYVRKVVDQYKKLSRERTDD